MMYFEDIYFSNLNAIYISGTFYSIPANANWSSSGINYEHSKLYYITNGECVIEIEGNKYHGRSGDMFFIPARLDHSYYNIKDKPFEKYYIHFDLYPDINIFEILGLPYKLSAINGTKAVKYFKKIIETKKNNDITYKLKEKSYLINLIAIYISEAEKNTVKMKAKRDEQLDSLLLYINENLEKNLSNDTLAEKYHTHPNNFIKIFKEKTGETPAKYIRRKKFEHAKDLLENTNLSISEIAEKIGITDPAHFSKQFKSLYNMSPKDHRIYYQKSIT